MRRLHSHGNTTTKADKWLIYEYERRSNRSSSGQADMFGLDVVGDVFGLLEGAGAGAYDRR